MALSPFYKKEKWSLGNLKNLSTGKTLLQQKKKIRTKGYLSPESKLLSLYYGFLS